MGSPEDCVQMNDSSDRLAITFAIRLHSVHAHDIIRYIACTGEPVHQIAQIIHPIKHKRKEEVHLCNLRIKKPMGRSEAGVIICFVMSSIDEHHIIVTRIISPAINGMYTPMLHAANTR